MNDCLFCKIISGEIPSEKVYEDEKTFAFLDIRPINAGHTLVVPKAHSKDILEADPDDVCALMDTVKKITSKILSAVSANAFNLGMNTGAAAGQVIFHTHLHIMPRFSDDGFEHWRGKAITDEERNKLALKIRESL